MIQNYKLPNFLIVGAPKCGTTSLWHYLRQHPDIYTPNRKELRFLASASLIEDKSNIGYKFHLECKSHQYKTIHNYLEEFANAGEKKAIGEASPNYLYTYKTTIPVIQKYIGDPKIIIVLRNPVDRAFSAHRHILKNTKSPYHINETRSFEECLEEEEIRMKQENLTMMHSYKNVGLYFNQVKAYMENFSNVSIQLFDDLQKNPEMLVRDLYYFLDVDSSYRPDIDIRRNVSPPLDNPLKKLIFSEEMRKFTSPILFNTLGRSRSLRLYNYITDKIGKEEMKPETRKYLIEYFREDVLKLQELIGRDLSHWLKA